MTFWAIWVACLPISALGAEPTILPRAHAHNDYEHSRPLLDALDHGFCGVEADVFLVKGELLVGHVLTDARPGRTLEKLYLDPLRERVRANGGRVYPNGPPLTLLIDFKSAGEPTYAVLVEKLKNYADMLTTFRGDAIETKAVTIVVSGNRPLARIRAEPVRHVGVDGRVADLISAEPAALVPMISDNWGLHFRWRGEGPMPDAQRAKLKDIVAQAHAKGRVVRFWATPENPHVWEELLAAEVDLINTDKLDELRDFLIARDPRK